MDKFEVLRESHPGPTKVGKRWRVTIARPGVGSNGSYSPEVLRETGPSAFPPGTKSFFKHSADPDPRDMVGTFPDGAFWNEEEQELQGDLEPYPRYQQVLNEAGPAIEASIRARAHKDPTGRVRELIYDRANSVDLVSYGGLEGSGLKFQLESLFAAAREEGENENEKSDAEASAQIEKEGMNMEIKEQLEAIVSSVASLTDRFETFVAESANEVQGVADEQAVQAAATALVSEALTAYIEKEKAINEAGLLPKQAEALKVRALNGEDIAEALVEAKDLVEEARKSFSDVEDARRGIVVVTENAKNGSSESYKIGQWAN